MSYEIIYDAFTLKERGKYIPFVVHGSNNCYEMSDRGRERRERNTSVFWLYSKPHKGTVELSSMDDFDKMQEDLSLDYRSGNIQGLSQTAINKRIKERIIPNEGIAKSKIISFYYLKDRLTPAQRLELDKKVEEFENGIKGLLFKDEQEKAYRDFVATLSEGLRVKVEDYVTDMHCFFVADVRKYHLRDELCKFKKQRVVKEWDWDAVRGLVWEKGRAPDVKDVGKQGFIVEGRACGPGSMMKGRLGVVRDGELGFFRSKMKRRYYPLHRQTHKFLTVKEVEKELEDG
jgi:hypothetical protein